MNSKNNTLKLFALHLKQDDPKKNTILKLARFNMVKIYRNFSEIPRNVLLLDPFSDYFITFQDRSHLEKYGICVIDCSWAKIDLVFKNKFRMGRKLPNLLAANSVNYGKWNKLSSAEALAASLFITGFEEKAKELLSKFSWGNSFWEINKENFKTLEKKN